MRICLYSNYYFFGPENKGADMSIARDMHINEADKLLDEHSKISFEEKVQMLAFLISKVEQFF